jgi:glycine/D-amino acid oxidase-like deaminating enzyme
MNSTIDFACAYDEIARKNAPRTLMADPGKPLPEYDVAIVGAGNQGLSAAETLIKRGLKVCILEAGTLGHIAASGRSAGKFLTGWVYGGLNDIRDGLAEHYTAAGMDEARALALAESRSQEFYRMTAEGCDRFRELAREYKIDAHIRPGVGTLSLEPGSEAAAKEHIAYLQARGFHDTESLGAEEVQKRFGTAPGYYQSGLVDYKSGTYNPRQMLYGLAEALQARGLDLYEQSPVKAATRDGAGMKVVTASGAALRAKHVYMAGALDENINPGIMPAGLSLDDSAQPDLYAKRGEDGALYLGQEVSSRMTPGIMKRIADITLQKAGILFPQLAGRLAALPKSFWGGTIYYNTAWYPELSKEPGQNIISFGGLGGCGRSSATTSPILFKAHPTKKPPRASRCWRNFPRAKT